MRALVQRVSQASVTVDGDVIGSIDAGLLVLVGATHDDTEAEAVKLAQKLIKLRIFDDADGKMNLSIADAATGGAAPQLLVVSQFTLYGDARKGNRPSYIEAARPEQAEPLVQRVVDELKALGASVETGRFQADMQVALINDGPVTIWLEI